MSPSQRLKSSAIRVTLRESGYVRGVSPIEPLNQHERERATQVAARLSSAWQDWLDAFPPSDRSASGLSRVLNVDRTTCQRLVYALRSGFDGPALLGRLPGIPGLSRLLDASAGSVDPSLRAAAGQAVDLFATLIDDLAGSQSRLIRRLDASGESASPLRPASRNGDEAPDRQHLFEAAAKLTGRWSDLWTAIYIYVPDAERTTLRVPRVYGLLGHRATPEAVPLIVQNFSSTTDRGAAAPTSASQSDQQQAIIQPFSSDPNAFVRDSRTNAMIVQHVDTEPGQPGRPVDLMLASSLEMPHPRLRTPKLENLWALIHFPARAMLVDAYMPVSEARGALPSVGVHLWGPDHDMQAAPSWRTRFPQSPKIQLIGRGLDGVESPLHARHRELTMLAFQRVGVDPDAYVGYRLAINYPIWRAGYCLSFDFEN
jgi:hypothetical protein